MNPNFKSSRPKTLLPGATLGILGGGQLGRMLAMEARRLGYGVQIFAPERDSPAGQVADRVWAAPYDDLDAVRAFAAAVDVATFEFENVPSATVEALAERVPVRPGGWVLHTTQQRLREKRFLAGVGIPVTPFAEVESLAALDAALVRLGTPAVLKTAAFGYDGKGQAKIEQAAGAAAAWAAIGEQPAILEAWVPFERELSVVAARGVDGRFVPFAPVENRHADHILDLTLAPAPLPPAVAAEALALAEAVLEALDVVGVMGVELFQRADGSLLVNELAPRPHNSGHWTLDGCLTSQFEQQLRAVCGLPLGAPTALSPAVMANLLGDLWAGGEPMWAAALALPGVRLHLYGKATPRPGRKMGHLTALAPTLAEAEARVLAARAALTGARPR